MLEMIVVSQLFDPALSPLRAETQTPRVASAPTGRRVTAKSDDAVDLNKILMSRRSERRDVHGVINQGAAFHMLFYASAYR